MTAPVKHRRRRTAARLAAGLVLAGGAAFAATSAGTDASRPTVLAFGAHNLTGVGSCDVTGVHVSYVTEWAPDSNTHVVTAATIDNIEQPTCNGAVLTVSLRNVDSAAQQVTVLAAADVQVAGATSQSIGFDPAPDATSVNDVLVELAGGATPIPNDCKSMKLKTVVMGTTGDDAINDTKGGNLIYGLTGTDTVSSGPVGDCVVVQTGNDTIIGGNGDDVVLADVLGAGGPNHITGGPGRDLIKVGDGDGNVVDGGNGDDTIYIGHGNGNTVNGGNGSKNVCHIPYPPSQLAGHSTVIANCKVVNP